jgi:hypothetical protein
MGDQGMRRRSARWAALLEPNDRGSLDIQRFGKVL